MPRIVADINDFVSFYEHDPVNQRQCIYFTKYRERCPWHCRDDDNWRAKNLRERVISSERIDLLLDYILNSCCRKAGHQNGMENDPLLIPLAERWKAEIQRHIANGHPAASAAELEGSLSIPLPSSSLGVPAPSDTVLIAPHTNGVNLQAPETPRRQNDIHSGEASHVTNLNSVQHTPSSQDQRDSEFRPHIPRPGRRDRVSWRMRGRLIQKDNIEDDFKTGSLYIFDRESSPGHVKIGWTSGCVRKRLLRLEKDCGYAPNPLYRVDDVPFARRVETLTHYELIEEWREELKCKKCSQKHQEWFEVSIERAKRVLREWASFFVEFEPYDSKDGLLKRRWMEVTRAMDGKGIPVTARSLLEGHHGTGPCGDIGAVRGPPIRPHYKQLILPKQSLSTKELTPGEIRQPQSNGPPRTPWTEPRVRTPRLLRTESLSEGESQPNNVSPSRRNRTARSRSAVGSSPQRENNPLKRKSMPNMEPAGSAASPPKESLSKKRKPDLFSDKTSPLATRIGESVRTHIQLGTGCRPVNALQPPPQFDVTSWPKPEPVSPRGKTMDMSGIFGSLSISEHNKVQESETGTAARRRDDGQVIVRLATTLGAALNLVAFFIDERSAGSVDVAQTGSDRLALLRKQCSELSRSCHELEQEFSRP